MYDRQPDKRLEVTVSDSGVLIKEYTGYDHILTNELHLSPTILELIKEIEKDKNEIGCQYLTDTICIHRRSNPFRPYRESLLKEVKEIHQKYLARKADQERRRLIREERGV